MVEYGEKPYGRQKTKKYHGGKTTGNTWYKINVTLILLMAHSLYLGLIPAHTAVYSMVLFVTKYFFYICYTISPVFYSK